MANGQYTPTQSKIMSLLEDLNPHTSDEVFQCLYDDMGAKSNISYHLTKLREILRPKGKSISCERVDGRTFYRLTRLMAPYNS